MGSADRAALTALAARYPRFAPEEVAVLDVADRAAVEDALAAAAPDWVFHLAAIAFAADAEVDPERTLAVNVLGTVYVIDGAGKASPAARVVIAGSSEAYGAIAPHELPIVETTPLRPVNLYGVSKAAADLAAFEHWWTSECPVVRVSASPPMRRPDSIRDCPRAPLLGTCVEGGVGAVLGHLHGGACVGARGDDY